MPEPHGQRPVVRERGIFLHEVLADLLDIAARIDLRESRRLLF